MNEAYIVTGYRSPVGKAPRGNFKFYRPDDLAVNVINHLLKSVPELDPSRVDDLIVGNAVPEAEQGMQMGRMISLNSNLPLNVPGVTVNRYCASGVETISMAVAKIKMGIADCIIAGGAESMSLVPTIGWKFTANYDIATKHPEFYLAMGITAEEVVNDYGVSREDQDEFAYNSHMKAISAIEKGYFKDEIVPIEVEETFVEGDKKKTRTKIIDTDEGPRKDTTREALARLRPVFRVNGTVTAGNSSQTSDGAAFVLVMSEKMVKELNLEPQARMVSYAVAGVDPRVMGIGPIAAIPKALAKANMKLEDLNLVELNEAFASQSLAVVREVGLNTETLNVNGGAIALGHPLGCTGAKLTISMLNELGRRKQKYGMVTACVGGGQGVASIFENLK
ncbi:MAG: acetyl-CoA C-acyltransferase [Melioribacteraceae bacterium]|jgi:acetyl-CoA acyltransferase|nr:acetyl-CoA C-acyltransferase [Melioribacteraceae bacterium]